MLFTLLATSALSALTGAVVSWGANHNTRQELTARVRAAEAAVAAANHRLQGVEAGAAESRELAEKSSDMLCRFAPDGVIRSVSSASLAILGHPPHDLQGARVSDIVHPDDVPCLIELYRSMVAAGAEGAAQIWRYRAFHADGRMVWLEGRPRATFDASTGELLHVQDVIRDITSSKHAEEALQAAQTAALAAADAKSEFLATMSHELRTPLTSIIGYAGLLGARGRLGETEARFVRRINDASRMLLTVVNDVLEFSKLEAGRTELERASFTLRELVDDTAALVVGQATDKGLALTSAVHPDVPNRLVGDPGRLRQVLLNLLSNGVKFTERGSVEIRVEIEAATETTARLTFSVADTGPGVAPETMDRLFERFSQADGSMSRRYGGTGLGLAICRGLVELMGGGIGVESQQDRGSRFWFTIDLPLAPAEVAGPANADSSFERTPAGRVLVADDSEANRELVRLMVTALGHDVDMVADGAAAVEAVRSGPAYDLVLMDVHMPVLDGVLATARIRALGAAGQDLPIVALTADVLPEQIARYREAGMDDHIGKPILPAVLAGTLARWLSLDPAVEGERASAVAASA